MMLEILMNAAVRMLLVGAAAWLALRFVRVRNPHAEALVWRMVLLAGLILPVLLYWRLAPSFTTSFDLPAIVAAGTGGARTSGAAIPASLLPMTAMVAIYLGVALLLIGRLLAGLISTWRVSRAAQPMPTPDDVRVSARVRSPATFGITILLPADAQTWPADRLDPVLTHERAHVRARDGYWLWLAQLHAAIFWFSPLAWWMRRRLETLAETTSDDAVVAARHDPVAYAALLLDFARHPNSRSVAMSVAESNVPVRIERLLARVPPAAALSRVARWSAIAALIPAVVLAASTTQAAPPVESATPVAASALTKPYSPPSAGVRLTQPANPDDYYPVVAKQEKVSGYAIVEVDVDVLGQLVDARVLKVQPAEPRFGFADAALQVARNTGFANAGQQAGSMKFMVKFELAK
jgi:TonB family protein